MRIFNTILFLLFFQIYGIYSQCTLFRNTQFQLYGRDCGQRCVDRTQPNRVCAKPHYSGCFCKMGYFRNWSWDCVRGKMCEGSGGGGGGGSGGGGGGIHGKSPPSSANSVQMTTQKPAKPCRQNEVHSQCGNTCTELCRNLGKSICPMNRCETGCFCMDGHFRGDNGNCIPQNQCNFKPSSTATTTHANMICPFGESFQKCGRRCSEFCTAVGGKCSSNQKCTPGCFCNRGYSRNILGLCVPTRECGNKGKCGRHEQFEFCGNTCTDQCTPPTECPVMCKAGCYCTDGYYRNAKRKCVADIAKVVGKLKKLVMNRFDLKCPSIAAYSTPKPSKSKPCGQNEERQVCGSRCGESCKSQLKEYVCPKRKLCLNGCFCLKGFHRNSNKKCVPANKCNSNDDSNAVKPKKCGENEDFQNCGSHCVELCNPPIVCPGDCEPGCFCNEGFYRNSRGQCVPESNCPPLPIPNRNRGQKCQQNEQYFDCQKDCLQNCREVIDKMVCPKRKRCLAGCLCKKGNYRDDSGVCVDKCPARPAPKKPDPNDGENNVIPECSLNEDYYPCGDYCIELCNPPNFCQKKCAPGCFCSEGFFRNDKGFCVPEKQCPNRKPKAVKSFNGKCTKPNEEYQSCGIVCGQSCEDQSKHKVCPMRSQCEPGCFCVNGFYRSDKKECVSLDKCSPPVGEFKMKPTTTPKPKPPGPQCKQNEHYDECGDHCIELCQPPDSCEAQCEPGCFCDKGFYRASAKGPCIPESKCPNAGGEEMTKIKIKIKVKCEDHEYYSDCGTRCGQMCSDLFRSVICPKKGLCVTGCFCVEGYYRNGKGVCVLESQCKDQRPPTDDLKCDKNEVFNKCGDRCKQSCEHHVLKTTCPENQCTTGCFCKEGQFKDLYGNCVPLKDCPDPTLFGKPKPIKCDNNEEFNTCGNRCGQTCEEIGENKQCPQKRACVSGCFCQNDYFRTNDGLCVPKNECPKPKSKGKIEVKCEDNEEYSKCNIRCGQGCDDLGRKIDCPKERQCASGCFCKDGFLRNENGDCVAETECPDIGPPNAVPKKIDCGLNEAYAECGTRCGQACEELSRKVDCPRRRICISGCFCNEGFFRNDEGTCVQMLQCPNISPPKRLPPSCDANEVFEECGHRCGQSCDDYVSKRKCPKKQVCVTGCFCAKGYKRDHNGECISSKKCPPKHDSDVQIKCGLNEEYSECGSRCGQGCEDFGHNVECPKNRICITGCFCLEGFYRNEVGDCVPVAKCPAIPTVSDSDGKPKQCGENERLTDCGTHCGQKCEDVGKGVSCPRKRMCISGCFCKKGFYRDVDDNCVSQRQCALQKNTSKKVNPLLTTLPNMTPAEHNEETTHADSEEHSEPDSHSEPHTEADTEAEPHGSEAHSEADATPGTETTSGDDASHGTEVTPEGEASPGTETTSGDETSGGTETTAGDETTPGTEANSDAEANPKTTTEESGGEKPILSEEQSEAETPVMRNKKKSKTPKKA